MPNGYLLPTPNHVDEAAAGADDALELVVVDALEVLGLSTLLVIDVLKGLVAALVLRGAVVTTVAKEEVDILVELVVCQLRQVVLVEFVVLGVCLCVSFMLWSRRRCFQGRVGA